MNTECQIPYKKIVSHGNDILLGMDERYGYVFTNKAFLRYTGLMKPNVVGHTAPEILGEELFTEKVKPHIDRSFNGKTETFLMPFTHFRLGTRYLHLKSYPIKTDDRMVVVVVGRDVTSLERGRNNLLWYRQTYRTLMDRATDVLLLVSPEGIINACSKYVHRKTGLSSAAVVGHSLETLLTPESYGTAMKHLEAWRNKHGRSIRWEAEVVGPGGRIVPFEVHSTPVYEKGKLKLVIVIARDISDQKHEIEALRNNCSDLESRLQEVKREYEERLRRMEEEFKQLWQRLLQAQEKEYSSIGAELHDEMGGSLTVLKIYFSKILKEPGKGAWLEQFRETFDEMVEYIRSLSHDLYPVLLKQGGLLHALEAYLKRYERGTGIRVSFRHSGIQGRLPSNIEIASYRIVQEALNNAAKHSGAESIDIELSQTDGTLKIRIEDNGKGFDVSKVGTDTYGLSVMKTRARVLGGDFVVESAPGRGTRIICTLPVAKS